MNNKAPAVLPVKSLFVMAPPLIEPNLNFNSFGSKYTQPWKDSIWSGEIPVGIKGISNKKAKKSVDLLLARIMLFYV